MPQPTKKKPIEDFIDGLIKKNVFRNRREIAEECGMGDSALSLAISDPDRKLSVEQCLRLARKTKMYPVIVLRMADRASAADVLDDVWPQIRIALTRGERELIDLWRSLSVHNKHHISEIIRAVAKRDDAATAGRGSVNGAKPRRLRPPKPAPQAQAS